MEEEDKAWEEHMKNCSHCNKVGKYNGLGGTTNEYHAFVNGYRRKG